LTARNTASVSVSRAGTIGKVMVSDGQWIEAGKPLFTYDTQRATAQLAEAEQRVGDVQRAIDALRTGAAEPAKQVEAARASVAAAQAELAKARAEHKRTAAAKAQKLLKTAQDAAAKAELAAANSRRALEAAAGGNEGELQTKLASAIRERDAQKALDELPPVMATADGFVTAIAVKPGDCVKQGAPVCSLVDSKVLVVTMRVDGDGVLSAGQTASLAIGGKQLDVKIESVQDGEGRGELDNASGTLRASTRGELSVDAGSRSLLRRWF
jgi:membrane fusion protein (multidrug efflux system)